jgi:putative oxidoreductase
MNGGVKAMRKLDVFYALWSPHVLSLLRIVVALLFMEHGTQILFGFPGGFMGGPPMPLLSLLGIAGVLEFLGGALMLIGLAVRPVAFILSGQMAVAYFMAHAPHGFFPVLNEGEYAVLYCFTFLYFAVAGGGPWSMDYFFRRSTRTAYETTSAQ